MNTMNLFSKKTAAAALLTIACTGTACAAEVLHFRSSGDYGCASAIIGPDRIAHLCVGADSQVNPKTVSLTYYAFNQSDGGNFMYGYGQIPASALHVTGNGLSLSIVPSSVPGFFMEGAGHDGAILITWTANGIFTSQAQLNSIRTYGNGLYRERWKGSERSKSADTSGAFFGSNFPGFNSNFGSTTNLQIYFQR